MHFELVIYDVSILFFFKQKTAYEMRISDWSSDVCSSDLWPQRPTNFFGKLGFDASGGDGGVPIAETLSALAELQQQGKIRHIGVSNETPWGVGEYLRLHREQQLPRIVSIQNPYSLLNRSFEVGLAEIAHQEDVGLLRSEEHTSELQSLMRISYAVFCLKKK